MYHKNLYYSGKSVLSDKEFDLLEEKLKAVCPDHPVLSLVGHKVTSVQGKVSHSVSMLSLAKTYERGELQEFLNKYPCVALDKLDGMALSLEYDLHGNFEKKKRN